MAVTNELKEAAPVVAPAALSTLNVNVFTAPGKAMVGERPKSFGEALGFDPITSTLIFGDYDAVLVDAMGTVAEAEALADWVALHNRNLETIYITHAHFDHFYGLSILLDASRPLGRLQRQRRWPPCKCLSLPQLSGWPAVCFPGKYPPGWFHLSRMSRKRSPSKATNCASSSRAAPIAPIQLLSTFHRSA